jgi:succinate dehydrogenase / fumarate reductase flavoprotein subunit
MFDLAGVVRTEDGLRKMLDLLAGLHERYERVVVGDKGKVYNTDLMEAVELGFLLDLADCLVAAALARDESRGGHYREDHPLRDDANWLKHSLAGREASGGMDLEYKDVKMGPYIPMERKY